MTLFCTSDVSGGVPAYRMEAPKGIHRWYRTLRVLVVYAAAIGAFAISSFAHAAPAKSQAAWAGVWRGTIGKAAVQVCLQHDDSNDFGAYYYRRHLEIISLGTFEAKGAGTVKDGISPVWTEAPFSDKASKGPLWHLTSASGGHLQGVWSDGVKSLPIDLASVAMIKPAADDEDADIRNTPCGNEAFSLPRFSPPVITTKAAILKGVSYTRLLVNPGKQFADSSSETFQLQGASAGIKRVNAALSKNLPTGPDSAMYFTCSMAALGQNGLDGDASFTVTPLIITPGWLVLQDSEEDDCGGAHPNSDVNFETWDLQKGTKVNLYDWFAKTALTQTSTDVGLKEQDVSATFSAAFMKLMIRAYPDPDSECKEAIGDVDIWDPHLTAKGIAFTPEMSHAEMACSEDSTLSFAQIEPYLTATGKMNVAAFQAEVRALK
ncbi:MAG: hypothetical protein WBY53_11070 [Acidobacteriaceae bacterium]